MYDGFLLAICNKNRLNCSKQSIKIGNLLCILRNRCSAKKSKFYYEKCTLINNSNGFLYQFFSLDSCLSEYECCDDLFDFHYIEDQTFDQTSSPLCYICLKNEYFESLNLLLDHILQYSDTNSVVFICYSGRNNILENLYKSYSKSDFVRMLSQGSILTDKYYLIY